MMKATIAIILVSAKVVVIIVPVLHIMNHDKGRNMPFRSMSEITPK